MIVMIDFELGPARPVEPPPTARRRDLDRYTRALSRWVHTRPTFASVLLYEHDSHRCLDRASELASIARRGIIRVSLLTDERSSWSARISGHETAEHRRRIKAAMRAA